MLQSSNDAALALAEHVGGTVAAFVSRMNRRAAALGLRNTSFVSPNGLDDRGHSTALDIATITRVAYRSAEFAAVVATKFRDIPAPSGPNRHIQNRNALLWLYPGAVGVKTGFTSAAGHCLVAAARRGSRALVSVVMGGPTEQSSFDDAAALLNYGFAGFARRVVVHRGSDLGLVRVGDTAVRVTPARDVAALVPVHPPAAIRWAIRALPGLALPVDAGQRVGRIFVTVNGRPVGAVDAVAIAPVSSPPSPLQPVRSAPGPAESMVALLKGLLEALVDPFL
jgi:D-alanyl-D-alanine carboxypeptidase (penicillin-binding protein 5/6)